MTKSTKIPCLNCGKEIVVFQLSSRTCKWCGFTLSYRYARTDEPLEVQGQHYWFAGYGYDVPQGASPRLPQEIPIGTLLILKELPL